MNVENTARLNRLCRRFEFNHLIVQVAREIESERCKKSDPYSETVESRCSERASDSLDQSDSERTKSS